MHIYMYMYIYMYIYDYVYIYMYKYICMFIYIVYSTVFFLGSPRSENAGFCCQFSRHLCRLVDFDERSPCMRGQCGPAWFGKSGRVIYTNVVQTCRTMIISTH